MEDFLKILVSHAFTMAEQANIRRTSAKARRGIVCSSRAMPFCCAHLKFPFLSENYCPCPQCHQ